MGGLMSGLSKKSRPERREQISRAKKQDKEGERRSKERTKFGRLKEFK
jgi:hypothetical protein